MNAAAPVSRPAEPELSLCLLEGVGRPSLRRLAAEGAASVAINIGLLLLAVTLLRMDASRPPAIEVGPVDTAKSTPLVFPRELTQTEPNRGDLSKEIRLQDLISTPAVKPQPRIFTPPPMPKSDSPRMPAPAAVEPPNLRMAPAVPPAVLGSATPVAPPPQIQPQEKPKLVFETPGSPAAAPVPGQGRIAPPRTSVEDAVRSAGRSGPGGVVVGDMPDESGLGAALGQSPSPPRQASRVELLSDPMGVDFRPYLIRVLTAVRQNWFAVIPESARLGRQGKVVIQFSINKSGGVPKLVIALPSGTEALDRAAVAGISASNPFSPLPAEFKGELIRVQLVFFYNIPR